MRNKIKITSAVLALSLLVPVYALAEEDMQSNVGLPLPKDSRNSGSGSMTDAQKKMLEAERQKTEAAKKATRVAEELKTRCLGETSGKLCTREENLKLRENKVRNLQNLMGNQIANAQKTINRLQAIIVKIQRVRNNLAEQGANLTEADALIEKAKLQKTEAEKLLADIRAKHEALTGAQEPGQTVRQFMTSANQLKRKLIDLHKTLNQIAKSLRNAEKALRADEEENDGETTPPAPAPSPAPGPTPTPTPTPSPTPSTN